MKLRFKDQSFHRDAINAVSDHFLGQDSFHKKLNSDVSKLGEGGSSD